MKIRFLGTGESATLRGCTSFVIDDHVLFDVGHGVVRSLLDRGLDVGDIDTLIISHFHIDHVGDLAFFLYRRYARGEMDKPFKIIGPKGVRAYIDKLGELVEFDDASKKPGEGVEFFALESVEIFELEHNGVYKDEKIEVKAFNVDHIGADSGKGFLITLDGEILGCSGDTRVCSSLEESLPFAPIWIVDCKTTTTHRRHMGLDDISKFSKKYPKAKFYTVHRADWDIPEKTLPNIFFPNDGDVVYA